MCVTIQGQTATSHQPFQVHPGLCVSLSRGRLPSPQPFHPGLCVSLSRGRLPPVINHSILAYVCHYPGADCHQSSTIPPWPVINHSSLAYVCHYPGTIQTATSPQPFHPGLCVSLSRGRLPPVINHPGLCVSLSRGRPVLNHSTLAYVCHYPGADCHQSSTIPPWPMCVTIQGQTATSHGLCVSLSRGRLPPVINHSPDLCVSLSRGRLNHQSCNHSTLAYVCHYPGADCHQCHYPGSDCHHQPFHPGLCVSLSRCTMCVQGHWPSVSLSRCRLPPVINHSTLPMCVTIQVQTVTSHQPSTIPPWPTGADCHQSSTIPPWPMCVTIQGQTGHQPFVSLSYVCPLSRGRLSPVINHSTLAYVCHYPGADCHQSSTIPPWPMCAATSHHYPGADCHQSSTIPPWPMCVTIQGGRLPPVIYHSTLVTIQGQTATSHQPFHPDLCVSLSRCRLPPVINHSTLTYVCHYPGADCHQSSTIPPWPMWVTIQVQTATSHQPFHPGLCGSLSRGRLPPVINHSTLAYVCHYPGADCHQSSTIPPWPMCVTILQTATSHQPFHPGLCVSLSCRLPPVINHSTLAYVCHYPGADCHQSSTIPPWPMCVTIQGQTATSHQPFHPGLCVSLSRGRLPPVINHSTLAYVCHYPGVDCHQSSTIPPWPMCVTILGPPDFQTSLANKLAKVVSRQQTFNCLIVVNVLYHFVIILHHVCVQALNMICLTSEVDSTIIKKGGPRGEPWA